MGILRVALRPGLSCTEPRSVSAFGFNPSRPSGTPRRRHSSRVPPCGRRYADALRVPRLPVSGPHSSRVFACGGRYAHALRVLFPAPRSAHSGCRAPAAGEFSRTAMRRLRGLPLGAVQAQSAGPRLACGCARTQTPQILPAPCTPRSRRRPGLHQPMQPGPRRGKRMTSTKTLTAERFAAIHRQRAMVPARDRAAGVVHGRC